MSYVILYYFALSFESVIAFTITANHLFGQGMKLWVGYQKKNKKMWV